MKTITEFSGSVLREAARLRPPRKSEAPAVPPAADPPAASGAEVDEAAAALASLDRESAAR